MRSWIIRRAAVLLGVVLTACATGVEKDDAAARLIVLTERWFEDSLALYPLRATYAGDDRYNDRLTNYLSPEFRRRERQMNARYLASAEAIDANALSAQDRITHEVFLYDRRMAEEAAPFPDHLLPLNQFFSIQNQFPSLGAGNGAQPFASVRDYDNWIARVGDFAALMRQAEANMREGVRQGVVLPRVLVARMLPQLEAHIVATPEDSLFWGPVERFPGHFTAAERNRLREAYRRMIVETVVPAYRRLRDYLRDEYLPHARETDGLAALPDGAAWYRHMIRHHTTLDLDPQALHRLGLDDVAANLAEMRKVMRQTGYAGELREWFEFLREDERFYLDDEQDILDAYRAIEARMNKAVPALFNVRPRAAFEVRAIESYRAASGPGAFYQSPSADGSRPGVFYVNTHDPKAQPVYGMETLFMHEAVPGHHFQRGLQIEIENLPAFRRFGGYSAYTEGWALYAESLGRELGFYTDPMQWYGHVAADQLRAMRLVVDTGLHAKGWTREQAIRYMLDNSSMAKSDVIAEVERYMAFPGQALSFKVGQRKIRELRERAEARLGGRFDVREFHRQVLIDGPLPLEVLERKIDRWIEEKRER